MPQHRRPTLRCVDDDFGVSRPPVHEPLARVFDSKSKDPRVKLALEFVRDTESAERGVLVASASAEADVQIFRRKQGSAIRGLTYFDADAAQRLEDPSLLPDGADEPGIEWLVLVDQRRGDEVYAEAVRLAGRDELLPVDDDYLRCHAELSSQIAIQLPSAIKQILDAARSDRGNVLRIELAWKVPVALLVMLDPDIEEIYLALPRSAGPLGDRIVTSCLALIEGEFEAVSEEVHDVAHLPRWVPDGWRCHHFMTTPAS